MGREKLFVQVCYGVICLQGSPGNPYRLLPAKQQLQVTTLKMINITSSGGSAGCILNTKSKIRRPIMPITPKPIPDILAPIKMQTNKMASCRNIICLHVLKSILN
jgi:hypothetical protein